MKNLTHLVIITLTLSIGLDDIKAHKAINYSEEKDPTLISFNELQDSVLKASPVSSGSNVILGGIGFGYMLKGGYFGMKVKYVSPSRWGTSLDLKFGSWKTKDLPSDYSPLFDPHDGCAVGSLNLVRVLTGHGQNTRVSVEIGPSLVKTDRAIITPNPYYDPNSIWHLSKYLKSNEVEQAIGFSMCLDTEMLLASFMTLDFSIFANINKLNSFLGAGFYFSFGDAED